jgi:glutamine amidotransferase PdxT
MKAVKKKTLIDTLKDRWKKYSKQESYFDNLIIPGGIRDLANKILENEDISEDLLEEISRSLGGRWMRWRKNHWDYLKKKQNKP